MNLIEAIKSGKPFRRPGRDWTPRLFSPADVLADDWEIQEPTVTITRAQLNQAVLATWEDDAVDWDQHEESYHSLAEVLARKLGLEGR